MNDKGRYHSRSMDRVLEDFAAPSSRMQEGVAVTWL
jgi:hypothetical protein